MGRRELCRGSGKRKFRTHEAALTRAGRLMERFGAKPLAAYRCRFCGQYHLTSQVTEPNAENLKKFHMRGTPLTVRAVVSKDAKEKCGAPGVPHRFANDGFGGGLGEAALPGNGIGLRWCE